MNVDAPVKVADLAPAGEPVALLPEGQRAALPQAGPDVAPATPVVADFRLDNGLRVLVAPLTTALMVSARADPAIDDISETSSQEDMAPSSLMPSCRI